MEYTDKLEFRKLDLRGLKILLSWARQEGWDPGPHDADAFWAADPEGFYGYFHNGELIAGGAIVSYGGVFGFMGLFIVHPDHRGIGIGRKLWYQRRDMLLSRLEEGAAIGMDGVVAMQPFYQKGGFKIAFRDERYERVGEPFAVSPEVTPVEKVDRERILAFDADCFGVSRAGFMHAWLDLPGNKAFKFVESGVLKGFVVVRKTRKGYKIGPLFANDAMVAEALYLACLNASAGEPVFLDIPVVNNKAVELVKKYNARYVFECARMYYNAPPELPLDRIYGVTTFELG